MEHDRCRSVDGRTTLITKTNKKQNMKLEPYSDEHINSLDIVHYFRPHLPYILNYIYSKIMQHLSRIGVVMPLLHSVDFEARAI